MSRRSEFFKSHLQTQEQLVRCQGLNCLRGSDLQGRVPEMWSVRRVHRTHSVGRGAGGVDSKWTGLRWSLTLCIAISTWGDAETARSWSQIKEHTVSWGSFRSIPNSMFKNLSSRVRRSHPPPYQLCELGTSFTLSKPWALTCKNGVTIVPSCWDWKDKTCKEISIASGT